MDKKGISAVVATVLIILITVAAVTIIWTAIIPMIRNNIDTGCFKAQSDLIIVQDGYTCKKTICYNSTGLEVGNITSCTTPVGIITNRTTNISVQVRRGSGDYDLAGVKVNVLVGGDSKSADFPTVPAVTQSKSAVLSSSDYNGATKIEVIPVIKTGQTQKTCEVASSVDLSDCS